MRENRNIDFARLLGFETIGDLASDAIDFQDEVIGAKLGAKVGFEQNGPTEQRRLIRRW